MVWLCLTGPGGWEGDKGPVRSRLEREHGREGRSGFRNALQGSENWSLPGGEPSLRNHKQRRLEQNQVKKMRTSRQVWGSGARLCLPRGVQECAGQGLGPAAIPGCLLAARLHAKCLVYVIPRAPVHCRVSRAPAHGEENLCPCPGCVPFHFASYGQVCKGRFPHEVCKEPRCAGAGPRPGRDTLGRGAGVVQNLGNGSSGCRLCDQEHGFCMWPFQPA